MHLHLPILSSLSANGSTSIQLDDSEDERVINVSERGGESFEDTVNSHKRWKVHLEELAKEMQEREEARPVRERQRRQKKGMDDDKQATTESEN